MFEIQRDDGSAVTIGGELPAAPGTVFDHLTSADLLVRWWPSEAETEPVPGGAYILRWPAMEWTLRGSYFEADRGRRLSFTWSWDHDDLPPRRVDIGLATDGDGTTVTVTHEYGDDDERDGYVEGWQHFLDRLAGVLTP